MKKKFVRCVIKGKIETGIVEEGTVYRLEGALFGDATAVDHFADGDTVLFKAVDDGGGTEGGGFDESA